ncbi:MAG: AIR synthase-related protein, partial [Propionicimonas sp.]|nr:AIR synthase-related protein [Propionicimonas sp.]
EEILMSESQERMAAVVEPRNVDAFMAICRKWDVLATVIGEVTEGDRLVIDWHGETVVDVDPATVAHEGPVYERPFARPDWIDPLNADSAAALPRPSEPGDLAADFLAVVTSPNQADKSWITDQYDRYVRGNSILAQPDDAGMLRLDEETGLGIALAVDCNSRFALLNPYLGAQLALAEAYRNVAASGAEPVAITDCLNFGSPEDPAVMWQFSEAILGLVDGCKELGTPVTGGNVSFYNQTGGANILPTPVVGMLGVIDDVADRLGSGFREAGDEVWLLGTTDEHLSGSAWAGVVHDHLGGLPPVPDLDHELRLGRVLVAAARAHLLRSAHDLADGGLAQALAESCLRHGRAATVRLPEGDPCVQLFSETPGRVLVSLPPEQVAAFTALAGEHGIVAARIGEVTDTGSIEVAGFTVPLDDLRLAWQAPIPAALQAAGH